ncbi:MAG: site-2 protease family protein [Elusimicrobia bacterium]|nr:site-2 protease family protein [Elusimicrobiota bacterium]
MLLSTLAVVVTFGMVIFLHEAGHFFVCRRLGVRVERFAFGFGPELIGVTSSGTRFSICAVPLGGYVKPAGESLEDHTGHPDEYFSRSPWERLLIVAAGPAMNYVLAFLMFFSVAFIGGIPEPSSKAVIGDLASGWPAAAAGLQAGDQVTRVDTMPIASWREMADYVYRHAGKPVVFTYLRGGKTLQATITPRLDAASGHGLIGIAPEMDRRKVGVLGAASDAVDRCWFWTAYTVKTLAEKIYHHERPDLAGPVGIVQMVSKAAHSGLEDLVFLIGLISVAIGFFNILPIPLLDGGHAVLYLWEGLSGRKLTVKIVSAANSVGLALLLSLLAFATYNDVQRIRSGRKAAREAAAEAATQPSSTHTVHAPAKP